tara:strand:- start:9 stop:3659 length:3651 start_codon:yes stop_codon:yes gene_type:complete
MTEEERYLELFEKSFIELYRIYYENIRLYDETKEGHFKEENRIIRKVIDNKDLDKKEKEIIQKNYQSYPDYSSSTFNEEISKKAEFYHCKGLLDLIELDDRCYSRNFELGKHQQFLRNFMNENTPYKGILIFHGVGVGKTCSAVTISSSFINLNKKEHRKIICLVSKNIQSNWMNTIYNPEKGENQCNGENFMNIIQNMENKINTSGKVKKLIRDYYEFYGYQQFSNMIKKLIHLEDTKLNRKQKQIIKEYFSNRILIIDEIHNLRDENLDKKANKEAVIYLNKVIKYSENLRLILMSATPMFNKSEEIIWLTNLLLKNDNRPQIQKSEIYNKKDKITMEGKKLLSRKLRGYISYVRGENPITFPIRLYPSDSNDPNSIYKEYPTIDLWGNTYSEHEYKFEFSNLYFNPMEGKEQVLIYQNYLDDIKQSTTDKIDMGLQRRGVQISNIVYPNIDILLGKKTPTRDDYIKYYGGLGLMNIVRIGEQKKNWISYNSQYLKQVPFPIFDLEHLGRISSKIYHLLTNLKKTKSKGIIFIYTEFIHSGIIPLALALEHMGFEKYSGNILNYPEWKSDSTKYTKRKPLDYQWNTMSSKKGHRAKYIVLSGNKSISPNNDEEIEVLTSNNNIEGKDIKIVIGSVVASEGIDLKNIREVHILDPWYNLSRIEQIIGRGIRYCSHKNITTKEERNVMVYLHVAGISKERESIDTYTYRIAEEKAKEIGSVEKIMKENAIDCYLNKKINQITEKELLPVKLIMNRKDQNGKLIELDNYPIHDKENSKVCSFSSCEYACNVNEGKINDRNVDYDTFKDVHSKYLFNDIKTIIQELYIISNFYTLDEIIERVNQIIETSTTIIYYSLYDMIINKTILWNQNHISGYLINKDNYYLFQPHNNSLHSIPIYYRNIGETKKHQRYIPLEETLFQKVMRVKKIVTYDDVIDIFTKKLRSDTYQSYKFEDYIKNFHRMIYFQIYLDELTYNEKRVLFYEIMKNYIQKKEITESFHKEFLDYYKQNIIYEKNEEYFILEKKGKPIGFFLFNTEKFMEKKKKKIKELDEIINDYSYFIYRDGIFFEDNELEDGHLIRSNIRKNFLGIKAKVQDLKTETIWGFPYKNEKEESIFKLVDEKINIPNKIHGRVISQIAKKNSIRAFIERYFKEKGQSLTKYGLDYEKLIQDDPTLEKQSKEFLYLLIEMIIRNREKKKTKSEKHCFLKYDIIFLKYIN